MNRLMDRLVEPFPWITFLPEAARAEFVHDFRTTARACAAIGTFDQLTVTLNSWQATAEAYATPHLSPTSDDLDYLDVPESVSNPRDMP